MGTELILVAGAAGHGVAEEVWSAWPGSVPVRHDRCDLAEGVVRVEAVVTVLDRATWLAGEELAVAGELEFADPFGDPAEDMEDAPLPTAASCGCRGGSWPPTRAACSDHRPRLTRLPHDCRMA